MQLSSNRKQRLLRQRNPSAQSVSKAQLVSQSVDACTAAPLQKTSWYCTHSRALPRHAESSLVSTDSQRFATQVASILVPWHVLISLHVAAAEYSAGQSVALLQQSPFVQQNPLAQWPEAQSLASSQAIPSARSGTHTLEALQCAPGSQSESLVQLVAHTGVACVRALVHEIEG